MGTTLAKYVSVILFVAIIGCDLTYLESADSAAYNDAILQYKQGSYDSSLVLLENFRSTFPWSKKIDESWYYSGKSWYGKAEDTTLDKIIAPELLPVAITCFVEVPQASSDWVKATFEIGYTLYKMNYFDSSQRILEGMLADYPHSSKADNAALTLGNTYRKRGLLDSALVWFQRVITDYEGEGSYSNALYWAGDNYYDRPWSNTVNTTEAKRLLNLYCDSADTTDDKYSKALKKLAKLGVIR